MKTTLTFLLSILLLTAYGKNATYEKLCDVNKCWREQKDVAANVLPLLPSQNGREWIRTHLALVESVLRNRNTDNLSATAKQNRKQCLDHLHEYMLAGRFPINEDYTYRTPIFIDKHDNFCAVGYLVKASGNEHISRKIAANTNLAYVRDMNYPELDAWAKQNGFTVDELAWIQPGYAPATFSTPIGSGVDGEVNELYVDGTNKLFVGGSFINAGGTIANNIAYITVSGSAYTWHSMGAGISGRVNAITSFGGNIFAGGYFSMAGGSSVDNVAYWDGSAWHAAGCILGTVNDLLVFGGELYAAGQFDVCGTPNVNFAKWNGSAWQPITGLTGRVNTMEVMGTSLLLGGAIVYSGLPVNAIKWNATAGFQTFTNSINNEVKDFEFYGGDCYAACKHTYPTDSVNMFLRLLGNTWYQGFADSNYMLNFHPPYYDIAAKRSFNTLCVEGSYLNMGGQFAFAPMIGTGANNVFHMGYPGMYGTTSWFIVDSAVNKMVLFNDNLVAGGKFKKGYSDHYTHSTLNGIARRSAAELSAMQTLSSKTLKVYPNPLNQNNELVVENNFNATHFVLRDLTGRLVAERDLTDETRQKISLPVLSAGTYTAEFLTNGGAYIYRRLCVE
ncbi:MAG: hypothetical protein K0Q79_2253 [Flavipsychrobacter sp.]|nr:hypothetical protein [Flavipsychrobacter sp.]